MKRKTFRNTVFLFIAAVIIGAFITRPGLEDFTAYLEKNSARKSPPSIEHSSSGLYSTFKVTYFEAVADTAGNGSKLVAVPAFKESYIGLFGRFWKQ